MGSQLILLGHLTHRPDQTVTLRSIVILTSLNTCYLRHPIMDMDRVNMMTSDSHGSLLNRVYELQCIRDKEMETMDLSQQMAALAMDGLNYNMEAEAEMEAEVSNEAEKYSQARARSDPVYILQQQQIQLQLQQQQQQIMIQQQQQQQLSHQYPSHPSYPSLVSHQQLCCTPQQL